MLHISNKDRFRIMNILNESGDGLGMKRLIIYPKHFPICEKKHQILFVEVDRVDTASSHNTQQFMGLVYSQDNKTEISLAKRDIYSSSKILLNGRLSSNLTSEEKCKLFVFECSTCDTSRPSALIGYADLVYVKDSYFILGEFLLHSVYDSRSLEQFELEKYLAENLNKTRLDDELELSRSISPEFRDSVRKSTQSRLYLRNSQSVSTQCVKFDFRRLDERLCHIFNFVNLPLDWTLLGQFFHIDKVKNQPRENLLHFCSRYNLIKFAQVLMQQRGSMEALNNINATSETPYQIAMKNRFNQIADIMFKHITQPELEQARSTEDKNDFVLRVSSDLSRNLASKLNNHNRKPVLDKSHSCNSYQQDQEFYFDESNNSSDQQSIVRSASTSQHFLKNRRQRPRSYVETVKKFQLSEMPSTQPATTADLPTNSSSRSIIHKHHHHHPAHRHQHQHPSSSNLFSTLSIPINSTSNVYSHQTSSKLNHPQHLSISDIKNFSSNLVTSTSSNDTEHLNEYDDECVYSTTNNSESLPFPIDRIRTDHDSASTSLDGSSSNTHVILPIKTDAKFRVEKCDLNNNNNRDEKRIYIEIDQRSNFLQNNENSDYDHLKKSSYTTTKKCSTDLYYACVDQTQSSSGGDSETMMKQELDYKLKSRKASAGDISYYGDRSIPLKKIDEEQGVMNAMNSSLTDSPVKSCSTFNGRRSGKLAKLLNSLASTDAGGDSATNSEEAGKPDQTNKLLPPLPRTNNHQIVNKTQPASSSSSSCNNSLWQQSEFERNSNTRRSKRFGKSCSNGCSFATSQDSTPDTTPYMLNCSKDIDSESCESSPSMIKSPMGNHDALSCSFNQQREIMLNNASYLSCLNSNLTKAMSTPSIVDKVNIENQSGIKHASPELFDTPDLEDDDGVHHDRRCKMLSRDYESLYDEAYEDDEDDDDERYVDEDLNDTANDTNEISNLENSDEKEDYSEPIGGRSGSMESAQKNMVTSVSLNNMDLNGVKINRVLDVDGKAAPAPKEAKIFKYNKRSDFCTAAASLQKSNTTGNINDSRSELVTATEFLKESQQQLLTSTHIYNAAAVNPSSRIHHLINTNNLSSAGSLTGRHEIASSLRETTMIDPASMSAVFSPTAAPTTTTSNNSAGSSSTLPVSGGQSLSYHANMTGLSSPHKSSYEQQQSTPLKNQTEACQKNSFKSRKFGNLFKLQSIRSAKSKSLKHKLNTNQSSANPLQHSFQSLNLSVLNLSILDKQDLFCQVCNKTLMNKKALQCKHCLLRVHESSCKDRVMSCCNKSKNNTKSTGSLPPPSSQTMATTTPVDRPSIKLIQSHSSSSAVQTLNHSVSDSKKKYTLDDEDDDELGNIGSVRTYHRGTTRPKSMDLVRLFQLQLSKSTSNMYSKSISEDTPDYETIRALRESVDSLNLKFDENTNSLKGSSAGASNCGSTNRLNSFKVNLNELNEEFAKFDSEFSHNTWADMQSDEFLKKLNKQSRNKQENIFEFMKTEVNYVKILSITHKVYVNVMLNECKIDPSIVKQMFPDLDRLIDLHRSLLEQLLERYKLSQHKFIESIGDILSSIFKNKSETMIEIYSKMCCMHLNAKILYKQLTNSNKTFSNFLQECRKHSLLKRYQIPDCLTIITQRLTKYPTLIENMIGNSKEDKQDEGLLNQALEKLRVILTKVNEAVAFHQNMSEFRRVVEQVDSKAVTKQFVRNEKEPKLFTKLDFDLKQSNRKVLSLNQITVKCTNVDYNVGYKSNVGNNKSNNNNVGHKIYKDVKCLTLNDMIVFLTLNDKSKYTFMNENSVLPCNHGILIRPSKTDSLINSTGSKVSSSYSYNSTFSQSTGASSRSSSNAFMNDSSPSVSPYIINLRTNQMLELTFPDENSKAQWLTLVHTHITPNIEDESSSSSSSTTNQTSTNISSQFVETTSSTSKEPSSNTTPTQVNTQLHHQNSCSSTTSNSSLLSSSSAESAAYRQQQQSGGLTNNKPSSTHPTNLRSNSNCSSIISSEGKNNEASNKNKTMSDNTTNKLSCSDSVSLIQHLIEPLTDSVNQPQTNQNITESSNMQLSQDLANIIYSFNYLIEQSLCQGNLMRSASSAGETITRGNQEVQISVPKRAETFNGASSSKEGQLSTININSDLLKSRVYSSSINNQMIESDGQRNCSETGVSASSRKSNNSEEESNSADSGFQSRLCMDFNHDTDDNHCTCLPNYENLKDLKQLNELIRLRKMSENSQSGKNVAVQKSHFENILKFIVTDYMRVKNENEGLKKELESKVRSIEVLQTRMEEIKGLDDESLQKKLEEIEKRERLETNNLASKRLSEINSSSSSHNGNKLSILVKCEPNLLGSSKSQQATPVKKDDSKQQTSSTIFL